MSNITLEMTLDEARYVQAIQRAMAAQTKMEGGAKKVGDELKKATKEAEQAARELESFAKKTTQINATPVERYRGEMEKLDRALKAGAISQETHRRATERAKQELDAAGKSSDQSFGDQAVEQLANFATGVVSISAAVGVVKQGLELVAAAREKALGSSESLDTANRELATLAANEAEYQALLQQRDTAAKKYGMNREEVSNALFNARSAGFDQQETETALQAGLVMDPQAASSLMVKSKAAFEGQVTGREALNMAFTAANKTQTSAGELARFMPTAMVSAKGAGFDFADTAALVAKGADRFKGADQSADRFANFFGRLSTNEQYKGRGMEAVQELLGDATKAKEFAGDSLELNQVLNVLRDEINNVNSLAGELRKDKALTGGGDDAINRAAFR